MTATRPAWVRDHAEGVTIAVYAQPGARSSEVVGTHGEALKVRVAAPPVEGAANAALIAFLAAALGVRARDVVLARGATGRQKLFEIRGVSAADAALRLAPVIEE